MQSPLNHAQSDSSGSPNNSAKPKPCLARDFSHYYSHATRKRTESNVKQLYKYFAIPGIHNLAGGLPHASLFPFDSLEADVSLPNRISPDGNFERAAPSQRLLIPKESDISDALKKIDLTTALQYGTAEGYPPLRSFIRQFVREILHPSVPYFGGPEIVLTCGSTDGFCKTIEAFTNIWDEDCDWRARQGLLCEEYAYPNAIQAVQPRGLNIVPVAVDSHGMKVGGKGGLADILDHWDFGRGQRPHLMYTVTLGQNPTGSVLPLRRRREIYSLCRIYDIIIIEDEPYWHLQYPSTARNSESGEDWTGSSARGEPSGYPFLDSLVSSYLSIDIDGRVIRLDTFSKIIAPGCRLGWLTAQPDIVERILRITETSTQQPSGFAQGMVSKLILGDQLNGVSTGKSLDEGNPGWRMDGWVRWLEGLRGGYEKRMQTMCTILEEGKFSPVEETVPQDVEEWEILNNVQMFDFDWPGGGMFVWIKICLETHPLWNQMPAADLSNALWKHLIKKPYRTIVAPGWAFAPTDEGKKTSWRYMRLCFAPMDESDVALTSQKFVEGIRSFWQVKCVYCMSNDDDDSCGDEALHP
ncbi:hypothetical protein LOZ64_006361 [Ophidiomyces ophidiicola]|nr:hypothetical protein LOZ64_006361 [Ophidiomyces ophidiicola]KAI2015807.1 hypothetical protein LOZ49_000392 [Ophidiomyces ophidiicola]KAI2026392.1 hypothetical protein LOZ46_000384 [Ophidiomyces ophidiicola]KAI2145275.1 hypothetical protein LOZ29_000438 [Ophidiomyces ophidiicola]KAI2147623.1 hypothetical protein LOZ28_000138 [Ophidiomyces ophidiicola]